MTRPPKYLKNTKPHEGFIWISTWRIIPGLGYVVRITPHDDDPPRSAWPSSHPIFPSGRGTRRTVRRAHSIGGFMALEYSDRCAGEVFGTSGYLGGGNSNIFVGCFQPRNPGDKWNPIWRFNIFQRGWLKPPTFEVPKTFVCLRWVFSLLSTMVNHHFASICGICDSDFCPTTFSNPKKKLFSFFVKPDRFRYDGGSRIYSWHLLWGLVSFSEWYPSWN